MIGKSPRILAFGDNVVDCYRADQVMYPGGNCVNHAAFTRRAGAEAGYAGAVSDDPAGRAIRDALVAEGVDVSLLRFLPGQTAYCVIKTVDGERVFEGANLGVSIISPAPEDLARIATMDAVHTGRSSHIDAWLGTIAAVTRLSYDFATVRDSERIARVARHCFLASFSGGDLDSAQAAALAGLACRHGARWAVVTRGGEGALLAGPGGTWQQVAEPVVPVDTLGAGDTFIARTLVGLLRGEEPADFLAAAARAAADTCLSNGAFGHGVRMEIDLSTMQTLDEIYATTRPVPGPDALPG